VERTRLQQLHRLNRQVRRSTRSTKRIIRDEEDDSEKHEEVCFECKEYGDVICCDTCPRVFHADCLGLKEIPTGEWSCYKCMQRLSQPERTTRSRARFGQFV
jgi:hypothetical protein